MTRLYDTVGWLLSSLGLALLVCGWVLVPQNRLLGEEEGDGVDQPVCPEKPPSHKCDDKCMMLTYVVILPDGSFVIDRRCETGVQPGQAGTCKPDQNCKGCRCIIMNQPPPFPAGTKACGCW